MPAFDSFSGIWPREGLARAGLVMVFVFALSAFTTTALANISLFLLLFCYLATIPENWAELRSNRIYRAMVVFALYVLLAAGVAGWQTPELMALQWEGAGGWILLLLFPLVGHWLRGRERLAPLLLFLLILGLLTDMARYVVQTWPSVLAGFRGTRAQFGLPQLVTGYYAAISVLSLIITARSFWRRRNWWMSLAAVLVWLIVLLGMLEALLMVQARGSWLALALVLPVSLVILLWHYVSHTRGRSLAALLLGVVTVGALLAYVGYSQQGVISQRAQAERSIVEQLFDGELDSLPNSSVGIRAKLVVFGMEKWLERPLLGWGPADTRYLVDQHAERPVAIMPHLHNTYLELLVRLGLVGTLVFAWLGWLLLSAFWRAYRAGRVPFEIMLMVFSVLALTAIYGLTNFRMHHVDWRFPAILFFGVVYAYALGPLTAGQADRKEHEVSSSPPPP